VSIIKRGRKAAGPEPYGVLSKSETDAYLISQGYSVYWERVRQVPHSEASIHENQTSATSVVFEGRLYILGLIYLQNHSEDAVWVSDDDGRTWSVGLAHTNFDSRLYHSTCVHNGKVFVIAGDNGSDFWSDVWSTTDFITWTLETADAGFSVRTVSAVTSYGGYMWLVGGQGYNETFADVWRSADGAIWELVTDTLSVGARKAHSLITHDDKMYLMGGTNGSNTQVKTIHTSTDGITWTPLPEAPWTARSFESNSNVVSDGERIYLIGGQPNANSYSNPHRDIHISEDHGQTWKSFGDAPWTAAQLFVFAGVDSLVVTPMDSAAGGSYGVNHAYEYMKIS
jgi:hypothetical protein